MSERPSAIDHELLQSQAAALEQLLEVQEQTVIEQSRRLEGALRELELEREALRNSEARTRSIIDAALDAVICVDAGNIILDWNPQAERIFGWSRGQAVGRTLDSVVVPPRFRERDRRIPESHMSEGEGYITNGRIERVALLRDGHEFPVEFSVSLAGAKDGRVLSIFVRDIAERKRAEAELARAHDEAVTASRLKSEFLATMSHEVRTPMNGVIGMAELLLATPLNPEQAEYAQTIQGSADALLTILNDILDFSKIEAGRLVLEAIPFDLRQVAEEVGNLLAPRAGEKGLELIVRYAPDTPHRMLGDPGRMRQVLINLAGNAIKFTDAGHVLINVDCDEQTETTARMRVSVEDTGIGIPEEKFANIFEKFTQADASTTRRHGGTGLGLAISKRLVELMGGSMCLTSRLDVGSTFWFSAPFQRDTRTVTPVKEVKLAGLRALIVDDHPVNRRVLEEQLAQIGISATSVADGQLALTTLREACEAGVPYHIGLLDYEMPRMDGEQLARAIKADTRLKDAALLLLSSSGGRGDAASLLQAGFEAVLAKPVRRSQLLRAVTEAWSRLRDELEVTTPATPARQSSAEGLLLHPNAVLYPARVLVAEDNPINQRVVVRMLEKLGCLVHVAINGKQAVEMVEALAYDLVFMDCQMPEMDGYEATAQIRQREQGRHTPIVALTANVMQGDRERCLDAGMDDYIGKPMRPSAVRRALERWVSASPVTPEAS
jgi:PAS domain S-box-containing protein